MIVCYMFNEEVKRNVFLPKWIIIQLSMTSVLQKVKFIHLSKINEMLYMVNSPLWLTAAVL